MIGLRSWSNTQREPFTPYIVQFVMPDAAPEWQLECLAASSLAESREKRREMGSVQPNACWGRMGTGLQKQVGKRRVEPSHFTREA